MDDLDQSLYVLHGCFAVHAMTEIEDIARPPGSLVEHLQNRLFEFFRRLKQGKGIQVALNRTGSLAYTTSELTNQPLWQINVDAVVKPFPANTKSK